ncbi:MAG: type VII toxin-antitoxin system MntA family adenylyltransferase antitoxin [Solirubrobacteraceae bacterium]
MTKIDERAHVPPVDDAARQRLAAALDREGVVAAMLIGSQARGTPSPLSDVDVAVWLDPALSGAERAELRARLDRSSAAALRTDEVDLVILNGAPPLLVHRALRDGVLLVDRHRKARVRLETSALSEYFDTAPLRQARAQALRDRLESGTFGRP